MQNWAHFSFIVVFFSPYLVNRAQLWIKQPDLLHILGQRSVLPSCFCTNKLCDFIFNRPSSRYRSLSETWRASDSSAAVTAGRWARWLLTCSTLALERALNSKPSPASSSLATPSSQECVVKMKWAMCNLPLHKAPQKEWEIRWGALFSVWIREQGVGNRSFRVVPMLYTDVLFFFFLFFFCSLYLSGTSCSSRGGNQINLRWNILINAQQYKNKKTVW